MNKRDWLEAWAADTRYYQAQESELQLLYGNNWQEVIIEAAQELNGTVSDSEIAALDDN